MTKGLYVALNVGSIEKSLAHYKALGFKARMERMGPMQWGSVDLAKDAGIVLFPKDAPDVPPENLAWLDAPLGRGVVLTVGVPDAEKVWKKATAAGLKVDQELQPNPWGGLTCQFEDPDGYILGVMDRFPGEPGPRRARAKKPAKAKGKAKAPARKGAPKKAAAKRGAAKKARTR